MYYQEYIETLPIPKLRELQNERLKRLVETVFEQVPFYKKKFAEAGISPGGIRGVDDLYKLPFTLKTDLRDNYPFSLFAVPMSKLNRIHCSSGTTGKPTVVGYTRNDIRLFAEVNARSLATAGARPGMKLHNAYGYGLFTGGLGLHYGGELLGMSVIPVSGGLTDRQLTLLQDFGSEVISCTPSYAQTLAEEIKKRGIPLENFNLKYAVLGAEPWTETIRVDVENGLGVTATNIYGLSEIIGPGVSQEDFEEKGRGSHIWEDHFFPEVVDPDTGEPVPEGEYGVLVFTTLTKEAMPLIRYWTNDITNIFYDTDSKRTHIKMGAIKGRADDMLIIRGVNLFPTQVEEVLAEIPEFSSNYQLVVTKEGNLDSVEVKVELANKLYSDLHLHDIQHPDPDHIDYLDNLRVGLKTKIKNNIGLSMKVTLEDLEKVPRSTGGKLKRVIDMR